MSQDKPDVAKEIEKAYANPEIPKLYANGFLNAIGIGDIVVLLKRANDPVAVLNLSYTTAKTLAVKLHELISFLEKRSNQNIMTTDDVGKYLRSEEESDAESEH